MSFGCWRKCDFQVHTPREAHRDRAVVLLVNGLVRVEEKRRGIRRCGRVEAQDHPDGLLLERAE